MFIPTCGRCTFGLICLKGVGSTTNYQVFMCSNNSKEKNGRQKQSSFSWFSMSPNRKGHEIPWALANTLVVSISLFLSNAQMKNEHDDPRVANQILATNIVHVFFQDESWGARMDQPYSQHPVLLRPLQVVSSVSTYYIQSNF